mgnify:CR=1 FL=1
MSGPAAGPAAGDDLLLDPGVLAAGPTPRAGIDLGPGLPSDQAAAAQLAESLFGKGYGTTTNNFGGLIGLILVQKTEGNSAGGGFSVSSVTAMMQAAGTFSRPTTFSLIPANSHNACTMRRA